MKHTAIVNNIFDETQTFMDKALHAFHFQYAENKVYRLWNDILHTDIATIDSLNKIPLREAYFS